VCAGGSREFLRTRWPIPDSSGQLHDDRDFLRATGGSDVEFREETHASCRVRGCPLADGDEAHLALGAEARGSRDVFDGETRGGIGRVEQAVGDGVETPTSVPRSSP